jgi:putative ABC transport system permease protein
MCRIGPSAYQNSKEPGDLVNIKTLQIAWRNMGRNKKRTALALLAIAVGQFALLASNGLMNGYTDNIRRAITGPMIGHVQVHAPEWRDERALDLVIDGIDDLMGEIQSDEDVEDVAPRIYAPALVAPKQDAFMAIVVGLDCTIESKPYGLLSGMATPLESGKVLVGHLLAKKIDAAVGQEIALIGQAADGSTANDLYIVQDIIKCPADLINQTGIVMTLTDAQDLFVMEDQAHEVVIRAKPGASSGPLAERLHEKSALADLETLPWEELVPELLVVIKSADFSSYFVLVLIFIAAVAGIANTLMMSTFERIHELGMLLALGCRPIRIVHMIFYEAILIALVGVFVGSVLGYGFVHAKAQDGIDMASWAGDKNADAQNMAYKGLNFPLVVYPRLQISDPLTGLIAFILTSLVASIWPAWIGARLEPVEAMRA